MRFVKYGNRIIDLDSVTYGKLDGDGCLVLFGPHGLAGYVDPEYVEQFVVELGCKEIPSQFSATSGQLFAYQTGHKMGFMEGQRSCNIAHDRKLTLMERIKGRAKL